MVGEVMGGGPVGGMVSAQRLIFLHPDCYFRQHGCLVEARQCTFSNIFWNFGDGSILSVLTFDNL